MDSLLVLSFPDADVGTVRRRGATASPSATMASRGLAEAVDILRDAADTAVATVNLPGELDGALHRRGGRTLVVADGDQGLRTAISALHRRNELDDTVLAMIPTSPGSTFARSAGIPYDPQAAARAVLAGAQRRFDLLVDCRGDVVVNHASVHARPNRMLAGLTRWSGIDALAPLADRPFRARVLADDEELADLDRPVLGMTVHNCPTTTGARACPEADPCDGRADVVLTLAGRRTSRFRPAAGDTVRARAQKISVAGQWFSLTADERDAGTEQRCTWTVEPQRLRMIVPE